MSGPGGAANDAIGEGAGINDAIAISWAGPFLRASWRRGGAEGAVGRRTCPSPYRPLRNVVSEPLFREGGGSSLGLFV